MRLLAWPSWALLGALLTGCGDDPAAWECVVPPGEHPAFALQIGCSNDFQVLGARPLDASIPSARSAKTIVDRAQQDSLYFTNTNQYARHHQFALEHLSEGGLPPVPDISQFNQTEYTSPNRRFLLGAVTLYEQPGIWTYELAPYDSSSAAMIETTMHRLVYNSYFGGELYYHPTSQALAQAAEQLPDWIKVITTEQLFAGITYQPLNLGESYGQLRFFTSGELATDYVGPRDIAVLDVVPNDISVVAGIITSENQTPLSHVNVLSQNRGTPNMALRGAHDSPDLRQLENAWVRLEVGAFEYKLEETTKEEADAWWEAHKPPDVQVPELDLSVTELRDIELLSVEDIPAFGAKASNYGVLARLGDDVPHAKAFAVPVYYYKQFEAQNGFDVELAALLADESFVNDPIHRKQTLEELQAVMLVAPIDMVFQTLLIDKLESEYAGLKMRFRSSTNCEDLANFSGAGLYSSYSGQVGDPTSVLNAVRKTWASLYDFAAFEERTYNGIPHSAVGMALLIHQAYVSEEANGVASTNNQFDETEPGFFVNVQLGEVSVVSPPAGVTCDSYIHYYYHPGQTTAYLSSSSLIPDGTTVLDSSQTQALGKSLAAIHEGFAEYYETPGVFYAMEVDFKFDDLDTGGESKLWVKQARPHPGWGGK